MTFHSPLAAGLALALALAQGALAQDMTFSTGADLELKFPKNGATQELGAFVEAERNGFYGRFLGKVAHDEVAREIELTFGYRGKSAAGLGYDLSYVRYLYPGDGGDCCGEFILSVDKPLTEAASLTAEVVYDPGQKFSTLRLGAAYDLTDGLALSGTVGRVHDEVGRWADEWDAGLTYQLNDRTEVDLRYYDATDFDGYLGLTVSFDTKSFGD